MPPLLFETTVAFPSPTTINLIDNVISTSTSWLVRWLGRRVSWVNREFQPDTYSSRRRVETHSPFSLLVTCLYEMNVEICVANVLTCVLKWKSSHRLHTFFLLSRLVKVCSAWENQWWATCLQKLKSSATLMGKTRSFNMWHWIVASESRLPIMGSHANGTPMRPGVQHTDLGSSLGSCPHHTHPRCSGNPMWTCWSWLMWVGCHCSGYGSQTMALWPHSFAAFKKRVQVGILCRKYLNA